MTKLIEIRSCAECYNLKRNKYTDYKSWCAEMSPDKLIDVDYTRYFPPWCPLPDKEVKESNK